MTPLALTLSTNDARLLQLALRALRAERKRAPEMADALCAESRSAFLQAMAADAEACKVLHGRIDDLVGIRRTFNAADAEASADRAALPDTPAEPDSTTDATGVLTGNADLQCERLPYTAADRPMPLPIYPLPGGIES